MAGTRAIAWHDVVLETNVPARFSDGMRVCWAIPMSGVVVHRRDRPSRGEHENPVAGIVAECVALGADTTVALRVAHAPVPLWLRIPTHVAHRNSVRAGETMHVSLRADALHVMPWRDLAGDAAP